MLRPQRGQTAGLLRAAAIGCCEPACEVTVHPLDARAHSLSEAERTPDLRNVQIGARTQKHKVVARSAVLLQCRARIGDEA